MRVLWLCNLVPPMIAEKLNLPVSVKEGWITGTLQKIVEDYEEDGGLELEIGICFPVPSEKQVFKFEVGVTVLGRKQYPVTCYSFYEDTSKPQDYCESMTGRFEEIIEDYQPDLVHAFGTEYPHTFAMSLELIGSDRLLIGLQGIISRCGEEYLASLPEVIANGRTFRDIVRRDSIAEQQAKFLERGEYEKQAIRNCRHVMGRTDFDREAALSLNPDIKYHRLNETMRDTFYDGTWDVNNCDKHVIFVSQADYPLKGFHYLLEAMPEILEEYPDATIKVAGNDITGFETLRQKIRLGGYGRYLRALMQTYQLTEKVSFLGMMNAEEMKLQYLRCHTYVCPSALENSPNSVAEAMLMGVPVVASDTGGIPSMIDSPEEGRLFPVGNSHELAENIKAIWKDDGLASEMSACEMQRAADTHNREKNFNRLIEIYREVIDAAKNSNGE
ncbi:MAG: glycosyltransferase family 4 protein [Lachnospiraceae bacterium]|nr:glycosyltransferase family 4 protein [Lachnospiraceae bacterium]